MATYFASKYDSARDEAIALLSDELEGYGLRDDSTGEADAPTGFFELVTIPANVDLGTGYGDELDTLTTTYGVTPADVNGSHIVTHNSQGFVSVESFDSEDAARETFACRAGAYAEWSDEDRDEDSDGGADCADAKCRTII